jgi:hypothetical protein
MRSAIGGAAVASPRFRRLCLGERHEPDRPLRALEHLGGHDTGLDLPPERAFGHAAPSGGIGQGLEPIGRLDLAGWHGDAHDRAPG